MKSLNKKIQGQVMLAVGFMMILVNAIAYVFDLNFGASALTVMGIVFIVMGLKIVRT